MKPMVTQTPRAAPSVWNRQQEGGSFILLRGHGSSGDPGITFLGGHWGLPHRGPHAPPRPAISCPGGTEHQDRPEPRRCAGGGSAGALGAGQPGPTRGQLGPLREGDRDWPPPWGDLCHPHPPLCPQASLSHSSTSTLPIPPGYSCIPLSPYRTLSSPPAPALSFPDTPVPLQETSSAPTAPVPEMPCSPCSPRDTPCPQPHPNIPPVPPALLWDPTFPWDPCGPKPHVPFTPYVSLYPLLPVPLHSPGPPVHLPWPHVPLALPQGPPQPPRLTPRPVSRVPLTPPVPRPLGDPSPGSPTPPSPYSPCALMSCTATYPPPRPRVLPGPLSPT